MYIKCPVCGSKNLNRKEFPSHLNNELKILSKGQCLMSKQRDNSTMLNTISHLSPKLTELVDTYKKLPTGLPTVAAFGLLKAGKSTFLNAFTNDLENSRFEHGSVRTTVQNQIFEHNNIRIMDTPGIDANDKDTNVAITGLKEIDLFLFVHNPKVGELDKPEVEFLEKLSSLFPNKADFVNNVICVLTHKAAMDESERAQVSKNISEQFIKISTVKPTIMFVESLSYFKAKKENKSTLLKNSGIDDVWELVNQKIVSAFSAREYRKEIFIASIQAELRNVKNKYEKERNSHLRAQKNVVDEVKKLREQIENQF
jgi:hypothetical protein